MLLFLSYSRHNKTFAERLARDLSDAGLDVWIDFREIKGGEKWRDAIFSGINQAEVIVVCLSPAAVKSEWVRREILMASSQGKLVIPIMVVNCFDLMPQYDETESLLDLQVLDFEQNYEQAFPALLEALPGAAKAMSADTGDEAHIRNPFKGLEAFQQTDADVFFGRERFVQKLLARLKSQHQDRFLGVVGASGSGKSSVVRAGLIPALRKGELPGSENWPIAISIPGNRPIESLATRLLPLIPGNRLLPEVVTLLEQDARALHQIIESILVNAAPETRVVLVIDQFEEAFTRASPSERQQFLDLIYTASTIEGGHALIVVTLRADFFDYLSTSPQLAELFEQEHMVITTEMNLEELRRSIEEPAHVVHLTYEPGLTDRILEDIQRQPGSLPLLQYALKELYKWRDGSRLTRSAYDRIGGVGGALAQHAESIFMSLDEVQREVVQRLMLQLIQVGDTGGATRRRVDHASLTFRDIPLTDVQPVIDKLTGADARLLMAGHEINTETTTDPKAWLEISHEALITGWPRFTDWVTAAQESLRYGSLITMLAQEWAQAGRRKEYLLSGNQLARAEFWLETADPSNLQRSFVETGTDFRKRNEKFQQVLQRFVFAFIGGSVAMILYAWINLAGPAILINEKIGRALSSGVLFGLSIALTVLVSDELPSQFLRQWKPWSRLVVSLLLGTTFGTLVWGSYQWMLLYLSVSEADFAALALGGLALTSGFALSRAFRVSSIPATVLTSLILFAAITFSYSNLSTPFIYFINSEVVVSQGLMIASVIAIGGHAQALWHDVRRMFPT